MLKKIATSLRRYSSIKFSTLTQKVQVKCSRHRENRKIAIIRDNGSLKSTGRLPSHIFKIELFLMAGALETPIPHHFSKFCDQS